MLRTVVVVLYLWEVVIPCLMMLVVVHAKQFHYQVIYYFSLSIFLRMEGCQQRKSRVELLLDIFPKGADKYGIYVKDNGCWKDIMFPNMFEEELSSLLCCRSLLAWYGYIHLGKYVDYY